ncbi:MAG: ornithine--oxo-acid transaminase [Anaerolineaceae bacterium]|nr:ornithine--oxo-acid transaminase [Anaerolineaceae bacterium]MDD4043365.1 ornithine--oxo-acid transaminase [Anaerolineaceae bacterium]MDD4577969.1 ornithine--oxo-acid transaminase [Anaerolineaceae bacterium]
MKTQDYIDLEWKYGAHNYKPLDVVLCDGKGAWVEDVEGKRYLDCLSAYSAVNQGHCHPHIVKATVDQAQRIGLTSRAFRNDKLPLFYKKLVDLTGYEMVLPMNTGAEAVETAIKVARKWAYVVKGVPMYDAEIIVAEGNFHGRTTTIVSFSTKSFYKEMFGPFTPGFKAVPFGDTEAIKAAITPNTAAVLLEPIQGENGVIMPPDGYLKEVAEYCREQNVLFIADEIQTGLCRTGKWFACQYEDVHPDITIIGKALSGGMYPVSAVLADENILGLFTPGEHGSTFGGSPMAAAIGIAALEVLDEENLAERAAELGEYFMRELRKINSKVIKEVRGRGMLIGVELYPEAGGARRYCEMLQTEGILAKETHDNVIRFAPPLVIEKSDLDWALTKIAAVLKK